MYRNLGELERAKEYHILAMEIKKEKLGPQHVGLATTYTNLGTVYRNLGELERAKEYHILAIENSERKTWSGIFCYISSSFTTHPQIIYNIVYSTVTNRANSRFVKCKQSCK